MADEEQYLSLIKDILENGSEEQSRNGITKCLIGYSMRFSLSEHKIPLLTTKRVAWKTCAKELFWFIRGQTSNRLLKENGVHIWDENASREFLDSRGLTHLDEDDLGPVYGHQWRHFNAPYTTCHEDYTNKGIDQLQWIIDQLKNPKERTSRRLVLSSWNPNQLDEMALPPCHVLCQFHVTNGNQLSCSLYQRSGDVGLGVPFNIASYSLLTHIIAKHCDLEAHSFYYTIGNAHIYEDHIEPLRQQMTKSPKSVPKVYIKNKYDNINDYSLEDVLVEEYHPHATIKMKMSV